MDINEMAHTLRLACIRTLLANDLLAHNAAKTVEARELAWRMNEIDKLPIPTKRLKKLFEDCHQLRTDRGEFPHPVSVADLQFCVKNRAIGYRCSIICKHPWLPAKEDTELRALPEFKAIATEYKRLGHVVAPEIPKKDDTNLITARLLANLKRM